MTALEIFRMVGGEFSDLGDDEVLSWMELCKKWVSKKIFKNAYEEALAYFTAHRLKINGFGELSLEKTPWQINSYKEGDLSISLKGAISKNEAERFLEATVYGMQFLALKRAFLISIRSAGEGA